jgi:hypothetical protein
MTTAHTDSTEHLGHENLVSTATYESYDRCASISKFIAVISTSIIPVSTWTTAGAWSVSQHLVYCYYSEDTNAMFFANSHHT